MSAMNYVSMTQGALIAELLERDGECVRLSAENKIMREAFRTILDGHKDIASRRVAADTLNAVSSMNDETYVNVDELLRENKKLFAENKRLEALDKDWLRASEQWVAENLRLGVVMTNAAGLVQPWTTHCDYRAEPDLRKAVKLLYDGSCFCLPKPKTH